MKIVYRINHEFMCMTIGDSTVLAQLQF